MCRVGIEKFVNYYRVDDDSNKPKTNTCQKSGHNFICIHNYIYLIDLCSIYIIKFGQNQHKMYKKYVLWLDKSEKGVKTPPYFDF